MLFILFAVNSNKRKNSIESIQTRSTLSTCCFVSSTRWRALSVSSSCVYVSTPQCSGYEFSTTITWCHITRLMLTACSSAACMFFICSEIYLFHIIGVKVTVFWNTDIIIQCTHQLKPQHHMSVNMTVFLDVLCWYFDEACLHEWNRLQ